MDEIEIVRFRHGQDAEAEGIGLDGTEPGGGRGRCGFWYRV